MAKKFDFNKKINDFKKLERTLPKRVGNVAKNFFLESFDREAFSDQSFGDMAWKKRKTSTKRDRSTGLKRGLLIQSGALKRSIKVKPGASFNYIAVGSYGIIYAQRHNRGLKGMPKRQFIGKSRILNKRIKFIISQELKKML